MANYLGMRILGGHMDYATIVPMYPQFKDGVDAYLIARGGEHLIVDLESGE